MGSAPGDRYYNSLPVWTEGNVYFNGAKPMSKENAIVDDEHQITVSLEEEEGSHFLKINLHEYIPKMENQVITTDILGMVFEPEQRFENPDGIVSKYNINAVVQGDSYAC